MENCLPMIIVVIGITIMLISVGIFLFKYNPKRKIRTHEETIKIMNTAMGAVVKVTAQHKDNITEAVTYVPNENYDFEKQIWKLI